MSVLNIPNVLSDLNVLIIPAILYEEPYCMLRSLRT
jgi:hypothetical protein